MCSQSHDETCQVSLDSLGIVRCMVMFFYVFSNTAVNPTTAFLFEPSPTNEALRTGFVALKFTFPDVRFTAVQLCGPDSTATLVTLMRLSRRPQSGRNHCHAPISVIYHAHIPLPPPAPRAGFGGSRDAAPAKMYAAAPEGGRTSTDRALPGADLSGCPNGAFLGRCDIEVDQEGQQAGDPNPDRRADVTQPAGLAVQARRPYHGLPPGWVSQANSSNVSTRAARCKNSNSLSPSESILARVARSRRVSRGGGGQTHETPTG